MEGILITFEGIDGCGKSTQIDIFHKRLIDEGYDVELLREPGGTSIGEAIRNILLDKKNMNMSIQTELLLFEAARSQIVRELINPLIEKGTIVLCDRFIDSSVAYQGYGRGLGSEVVEELNNFSVKTTIPKITYLFDIEPELALSRLDTRQKQKDRLDAEDIEFMHRVADGYREIASKHKDRIKVLNAKKSVEELSREIYKIFEEVN